MAAAKKCDICGRLYEIYNDKNDSKKVNGFQFLNLDSNGKYFSHKAKDCCPRCMDKIIEYLDVLKDE